MKMKRSVTIAVTAAVSAALMVTSAVTAAANVSGYEKLQAASFALMKVENYTADFDMKVSFDNEVFAETSIEMRKESNEKSYMKTTGKSGEQSTVSEIYTDGQGSTMSLTIDGEEKLSKRFMPQAHNSVSGMNGITDTQKRFMQALMDMFVGDSKNYFTNKDGEISVRLEGKQIPEIAQLALAAITEEARRASSDMNSMSMSYSTTVVEDEEDDEADVVIRVSEIVDGNIVVSEYDAGARGGTMVREAQVEVGTGEQVFANLVDGVVFTEVQVTAVLDEAGRISSVSGFCTFQGNDADGVTHTGRIDTVGNVSNYGSTIAE